MKRPRLPLRTGVVPSDIPHRPRPVSLSRPAKPFSKGGQSMRFHCVAYQAVSRRGCRILRMP